MKVGSIVLYPAKIFSYGMRYLGRYRGQRSWQTIITKILNPKYRYRYEWIHYPLIFLSLQHLLLYFLDRDFCWLCLCHNQSYTRKLPSSFFWTNPHENWKEKPIHNLMNLFCFLSSHFSPSLYICVLWWS